MSVNCRVVACFFFFQPAFFNPLTAACATSASSSHSNAHSPVSGERAILRGSWLETKMKLCGCGWGEGEEKETKKGRRHASAGGGSRTPIHLHGGALFAAAPPSPSLPPPLACPRELCIWSGWPRVQPAEAGGATVGWCRSPVSLTTPARAVAFSSPPLFSPTPSPPPHTHSPRLPPPVARRIHGPARRGGHQPPARAAAAAGNARQRAARLQAVAVPADEGLQVAVRPGSGRLGATHGEGEKGGGGGAGEKGKARSAHPFPEKVTPLFFGFARLLSLPNWPSPPPRHAILAQQGRRLPRLGGRAGCVGGKRGVW